MSTTQQADAFLDDIVAVYRKHRLALGHEDRHGNFTVEPLTEESIEWLMSAAHNEEPDKPMAPPVASKATNHRSLTTDEAMIAPGQRAILSTPRAEVDFLIASMSAPDNALRYAALRCDFAQDPDKPRHWTRRLADWLLNRSAGARTIYQAAEPEDFDDFLLSLIAPPDSVDDCEEAGVTNFEGAQVPVGTSAKLAQVRAGERLCLHVFNPTDKPIVAKVTFAGPGIE